MGAPTSSGETGGLKEQGGMRLHAEKEAATPRKERGIYKTKLNGIMHPIRRRAKKEREVNPLKRQSRRFDGFRR